MSFVATVYGFDLNPPTVAPEVELGTVSGNLAQGLYSYKISYITPYGETECGPASAPINPGSTARISAVRPEFVNQFGLYRTVVGGTGSYFKVAEFQNNYIDNTIDADLGPIEPFESFGSSIGIENGFIAKSRPNVKALREVDASGTTQLDATKLFAEHTIVVSGTGGVKLLPISANHIGLSMSIDNSSGAPITVYPSNPAHTISGSANIILADGDTISLICNSANSWREDTSVGVPGGSGFSNFSAGTTGLTPAALTTGNVTLGGVLGAANGGTGLTVAPPAGIVYSTGAVLASTAGTPGQLLIQEPVGYSWSAFTVGPSSISGLTSITGGPNLTINGDVSVENLTVTGVVDQFNPAKNITTATYTVEPRDSTLLVDVTGMTTLQFPAANTLPGKYYYIKANGTVRSQSSNIVVPFSTATSSAIIQSPVTCATLQSDGTNWVNIL